ncbi:DUF1642 domain-containing protein [Lacticaseibacillus paracasei]|uniref:DUF1642 domain-containing protein n=1 Tax=Lacticaseibacillus paracasei TaxID=1597 RepID=UPI0021E727A9|nr:DUF1642 domain-containing protein [Lacticaseibacillus paracasei]UYI60211.1 DUF1642 domain-containing protein [Lacticaseibacillus paracasei]
MSEEKMYAVKNDEGKYWDFSDNDIFWSLAATRCPTVHGINLATSTANEHGGHVVTLIEEPKKVVLSKEQAEIIDDAHDAKYPASYIVRKSADEELLMNAYVNGYTVAKEKKYNVKVPHAEGWYFQKYSSASKLGPRNNWRPCVRVNFLLTFRVELNHRVMNLIHNGVSFQTH